MPTIPPPKREQRLVVDRQLAQLVGHPQLVGQLAPATAVLADHRVVGLVAGRSAPLGLVHGGIGLGQAHLGIGVRH